MRPSPGNVAPLPQHTRSILRSTIILASLVQLVSELIQNSLDANAHHVEIAIDCDEWSCLVQDDGDGIAKDNLDVIANGSSSRYSTSKSNDADLKTFGFRGEALASIADLSILEISSRTSISRQSWSVILKGNQSLYTGPSIRWKRESHGTTICVRDAFHNFPVRRNSHPPPARTLEMIRREIETYALMFSNTSFNLKHLQTQNRLMSVPKAVSTIGTFRHLYGRALVQHVEEINETCGELRLKGFISLNGAPSKNYQFLYINTHPLTVCDLHRVIDNKFSSSTFAKHAYDEAGETVGPRSNSRRSIRKVEKRPVYVLNITVPPKQVDNLMDPSKSVVQIQNNTAVSTFLARIVEDFLIGHRFKVEGDTRKAADKQVDHEQARPTKKRKIAHDSPPEPAQPIQSSDLCRRPFDEELYTCYDEGTPEELIWIDPSTGKRFVVNSKTGNSYPSTTDQTTSAQDVGSSRRTISPAEDRNAQSMPGWIRTALQTNDVYVLTEPKIPAITLNSVFASDMQRYESLSISTHTKCGHHPAYGVRDSASRFAREDLQQAIILGQVDKKFVACIMDGESNGSRSLVLIDQHAADERVRVERFLRDLCTGFLSDNGVETALLDPALPILLTRHEALTLKRSADAQDGFAKWGIQFDQLADVPDVTVDEATSSGYVQVFVRTVPEIVGNKLIYGDNLCELVKGYLAFLNTDGPAPSQTQSNVISGEFAWQKAVRKCPSQLLDLVNSKACRGAIMFNDPLSVQQCESLVDQLAKTAFPFRCAHGRPSLAPLIALDTFSLTRRKAKPINWEKFDLGC